MATVVETHATRWLARRDASRDAKRDAKVRREGIEQGIEQGIERGRVEGQRAQLRRLAEVRFDADTAERLAALIEHIDDSARLDRIGEWILTCESGGEFLARIANGHLPNGESSD